MEIDSVILPGHGCSFTQQYAGSFCGPNLSLVKESILKLRKMIIIAFTVLVFSGLLAACGEAEAPAAESS